MIIMGEVERYHTIYQILERITLGEIVQIKKNKEHP